MTGWASWRRHVLTGVLCSGVGIVLGIAVGTRIGVRMDDKFSLASEARYSRTMFCFAPTDKALPAAEAYLQRISGVEGNDLIRRERVFASGALAILEQRLKSDKAEAAWADAQKACKLAEYRDCSRDWLTRLLSTVCDNGGAK
jgi:hypothetical protein